MNIYTIYTEELDDIYDIMILDKRLKLHKGYFFYSGNGIFEIETEYNIRFNSKPSPLFDIFMDELNSQLKYKECLLDCKEMFQDDVLIMDEDSELFKENFDEWLDELRQLFTESVGFLMKDYNRASNNYEELLRNIARMI